MVTTDTNFASTMSGVVAPSGECTGTCCTAGTVVVSVGVSTTTCLGVGASYFVVASLSTGVPIHVVGVATIWTAWGDLIVILTSRLMVAVISGVLSAVFPAR